MIEIYLGHVYQHMPTGLKGVAIALFQELQEGLFVERVSLYNQDFNMFLTVPIKDVAWIYQPSEK